MAEEWSFDRIAAAAMRTYPAVESRRQGEQGAESDLESAKWQRFPVPGVQASTDTRGSSNLTFSVQQPLWTGGKVTAGIDAATARLLAAKENTRATQYDVLSRTIEAYVDAAQRQRQLEILDMSIRQHEQLRGMITRRVERQFSPHADLELASSRLRTADNEKSYAVQALAIALSQLSELAGVEVEKVATELQDLIRALPETKESAIAQASADSPTLAYLTRSRAAAEADVESKRAAFWPALSLRLEKTAGSASDQRALMMVESQFGAGLSAGSNVDSAVASLKALQFQQNSAERELRTKVQQQWNTYLEARRRYDNSAETTQSAWRVYESYVRLYAISQKSWLDVLNQLREAIQAELGKESAHAEIARSALQLKLLTGQLRQQNPTANANGLAKS